MRHVSKKIITPLINEMHMLVGSYFYTHVSHLLGFDTDNVVLFDTKYFFHTNTHHINTLRNPYKPFI